MKHILAPQLAAGDANKATFFIACNYSSRACHMHTRIYITDSSQESQLLSISELNSPKRSLELFVKPGKAIYHHPCLPVFPALSLWFVSSWSVIVELTFAWVQGLLCDTNRPFLVWAERRYWIRHDWQGFIMQRRKYNRITVRSFLSAKDT